MKMTSFKIWVLITSKLRRLYPIFRVKRLDPFGYCWIPMDPDASYWSWWIQLKMIDPWQSWWNLTKQNSVFNLDKFHPNPNPNPNPNSYPNPDTYPNSYLFLIWLWMNRAINLQSSSHKHSVKTWSYIYTVWAQSSLHTFLIEGVLVLKNCWREPQKPEGRLLSRPRRPFWIFEVLI